MNNKFIRFRNKTIRIRAEKAIYLLKELRHTRDNGDIRNAKYAILLHTDKDNNIIGIEVEWGLDISRLFNRNTLNIILIVRSI
jgi:hypothetical protein